MTTERAGSTANAYLCRWGCGNGQSWATRRDGHEKNKHGALFGGPLAHEVNKHRTEAARLFAMLNERTDEADALRAALAALVAAAQVAVHTPLVGVELPAMRLRRDYLRGAIASAEAALNIAGGKP